MQSVQCEARSMCWYVCEWVCYLWLTSLRLCVKILYIMLSVEYFLSMVMLMGKCQPEVNNFDKLCKNIGEALSDKDRWCCIILLEHDEWCNYIIRNWNHLGNMNWDLMYDKSMYQEELWEEVVEVKNSQVVHVWENVVLTGGTIEEFVHQHGCVITEELRYFMNKWGQEEMCIGKCKHVVNHSNVLLKPCVYLWEAIRFGRCDKELSVLYEGCREGFRIINDEVVSSYDCSNYNSILKSKAKKLMDKTVREEIGEGIVSVVSKSPHCVHALGAVDKDNGKAIRCITDASRPKWLCINNCMNEVAQPFSYITVKDVAKNMTPNCYMIILDIKNAYRSIPVYGPHRTLQGFRWQVNGKKEFLVSNSMTFGIKCAPYIFTLHTEFIVRCMNRRGYDRVFGYLDDFLLMSDSEGECLKMLFDMLNLLRSLGFYVNYRKTILPTQKIRYLGIDLDSTCMRLFMPEDKLEKLHLLVDEFQKLKKCTKKQLQQLVGVLSHCSTIIRGGRTFSRRAINLIKTVERQSDMIRLTDNFREDLRWWKHFSLMFNGSAAIIKLEFWNCITMYSDASMLGFGATYDNDWLYGTWDNDVVEEFDYSHHFVLGPTAILKSSAERELWPIVTSVIRWGKIWSGKAIHVFTDNAAVQIMLSKGRSRNVLCMQWLREIFWCSFVYNFEIFPHRISSADNVFCDALSRVKGQKFRDIVYDYVANREFCCFSCRR